MIDGIRLKVCGLTSLVDAEAADRCGADYLGFILYPKSPRHVSLAQFQAMAPRLPARRKVAVAVEPSSGELAAVAAAGFDYFQVHFQPDSTGARVTEWSRTVGRDRLWLAPKLPPAEDVTLAMLAAAKFILLDTFHAAGYGGSGRPGDWPKFARHQAMHPENFWILAGGLDPQNIGEAVAQSGARFVDVNSGVESAPGVKDQTKLERFVAGLRDAAHRRR
jgi:phosphoribosylanthranilate isomerase